MASAEIAANVAARKINFNASPQDIEDMRQEAALAIWQNLERGERYAFKCGINAALKWWRRFVMDWHRNDAQPEPTPQSLAIPVSFFETEDGKSIFDEMSQGQPDDLAGLPDDIIEQLVDLFLEARAKKGQRGFDAAIRDTQIVALLCQGYTNEGISQSLGISSESVKRYRYQIRKYLRGMAPHTEGRAHDGNDLSRDDESDASRGSPRQRVHSLPGRQNSGVARRPLPPDVAD